MICKAPYGCALPFDQCCGNASNRQNRMVYNPETGKYETEKTFEEMKTWSQKMSKLTNTAD
jgi:hypothetical protein